MPQGCKAFHSVLAVGGRSTVCMGLAVINSPLYRNAHKVFHVDQHRRIDAPAWVSANTESAFQGRPG